MNEKQTKSKIISIEKIIVKNGEVYTKLWSDENIFSEHISKISIFPKGNVHFLSMLKELINLSKANPESEFLFEVNTDVEGKKIIRRE